MGLGSFTIALILFGLALAMLIGLSWLLMNPLLSSMRGRKGTSTHRKFVARLGRVDALISEQKPAEALKQLRKAIVRDSALNESAIRKLKEHHQNVLSRCLILAEETGSRAENLPQAGVCVQPAAVVECAANHIRRRHRRHPCPLR